MRHQEVASLIERLRSAVEHIPPPTDPEIYALLKAVNSAFSGNDEKGVVQATRLIEEHALYRYEAVVALAGELLRELKAG